MSSLAPPTPLHTSSCHCTTPNFPNMVPTSSDSQLSPSVTTSEASSQDFGEEGTVTLCKRKKKGLNPQRLIFSPILSKSKKYIAAPIELNLHQDNGTSVATSSVNTRGVQQKKADKAKELALYFFPLEHINNKVRVVYMTVTFLHE
ncbi:hypothetical protein DFH28DRAFT_1080066 [Melampsora americana]|nr:hypothetical protein DFH28DRAFT_1080066 [Melampsora americana]